MGRADAYRAQTPLGGTASRHRHSPLCPGREQARPGRSRSHLGPRPLCLGCQGPGRSARRHRARLPFAARGPHTDLCLSGGRRAGPPPTLASPSWCGAAGALGEPHKLPYRGRPGATSGSHPRGPAEPRRLLHSRGVGSGREAAPPGAASKRPCPTPAYRRRSPPPAGGSRSHRRPT
jgi:hypothetical protein